MDRSGAIEKLKERFETLYNCNVHMSDYDEDSPIVDAIADLYVAEAFYAGLSDRLIGNPNAGISVGEQVGIQCPLFVNPGIYRDGSGIEYDLRPFPDVLKFAQILHDLRRNIAFLKKVKLDQQIP